MPSSSLREAAPAVASPVVQWLRLEGLAITAIATLLYAHSAASWWLFLALWLIPDLFMLGYLAGPRIGSYCYNSVHTYTGPIALAAAALLIHRPALLPYAYIWFHHIGIDRLLGYGLKYPYGFGSTHLSAALPRSPKEL